MARDTCGQQTVLEGIPTYASNSSTNSTNSTANGTVDHHCFSRGLSLESYPRAKNDLQKNSMGNPMSHPIAYSMNVTSTWYHLMKHKWYAKDVGVL